MDTLSLTTAECRREEKAPGLRLLVFDPPRGQRGCQQRVSHQTHHFLPWKLLSQMSRHLPALLPDCPISSCFYVRATPVRLSLSTLDVLPISNPSSIQPAFHVGVGLPTRL